MESRLFKNLTHKEIYKSFLNAKIIANPKDYVLTNRLICTGFRTDTSATKYSIFSRTSVVEHLMCSQIINKASFIDDSEFNDSEKVFEPNVILDSAISDINYESISDYVISLEHILTLSDNFGFFINHNNLIVNEHNLISALDKYENTFTSYSDDSTRLKSYNSKKYFTALECLFLKSSSDLSIIPQLLFAVTTYGANSFKDLLNIKFLEDRLLNGHTIEIVSCPASMIFDEAHVFDNILLNPLYLTFDNIKASSLNDDTTEPLLNYEILKDTDSLNGILYFNLLLGSLYLCELLYHLSQITDKNIQNILFELFNFKIDSSSYIAKYFYHNSKIHEQLIKCFTSECAKRYENFTNYVLNIFKTDTILNSYTSDIILKHLKYFSFPTIIASMVNSCHHSAIQNLRLKIVFILRKYFKKIPTAALSKYALDKDCENDENDEKFSEFCTDDLFEVADSWDGEDLENTDKSKENSESAITLDVLDNSIVGIPKYKYELSYETDNSSNAKDAYYKIAKTPTIDRLCKLLIKKIKDIKTYNTGGKNSGLSSGKLDMKNIYQYKYNKNIFYNNSYKIKEMDLAFGIVLDMSGSMSGKGIENGKISMILINEVLTALNINHCIIGHDSNRDYQCNIYKYYNFNEEAKHTIQKPYALAKIRPHSGNCDSGALAYMEALFRTVKNKDKICIIFSDGEPTECSDSDLKKQVLHMEKNGIHVIGIGINFSNIKEYYNDYANGRNLSEMTDIIIEILSRYVLEKKE